MGITCHKLELGQSMPCPGLEARSRHGSEGTGFEEKQRITRVHVWALFPGHCMFRGSPEQLVDPECHLPQPDFGATEG